MVVYRDRQCCGVSWRSTGCVVADAVFALGQQARFVSTCVWITMRVHSETVTESCAVTARANGSVVTGHGRGYIS
jgi:hypothetical protein